MSLVPDGHYGQDVLCGMVVHDLQFRDEREEQLLGLLADLTPLLLEDALHGDLLGRGDSIDKISTLPSQDTVVNYTFLSTSQS